jgi:hypothetical protein
LISFTEAFFCGGDCFVLAGDFFGTAGSGLEVGGAARTGDFDAFFGCYYAIEGGLTNPTL